MTSSTPGVNMEDDKKVDILLQRDQTIAEVCYNICHMPVHIKKRSHYSAVVRSHHKRISVQTLIMNYPISESPLMIKSFLQYHWVLFNGFVPLNKENL